MDPATKDILLAFFGCTVPFGLLLAFVLLWRYMRHREVLRMLELGIPPGTPTPGAAATPPVIAMPAPPGPPTGRALLAWGLVLVGVGLAFTFALWPIGFLVDQESGIRLPLALGPWMLVGFVPLFIGLALTLTYVLTRPATAGAYAPPSPAESPAPPVGEEAPPPTTGLGEAR